VGLEISNAPDANPHRLTIEQVRLAILDGRLTRHPYGPSILDHQLYQSFGYTFQPPNPKSILTMLVFVVYTESPAGDRFVHYVRRATREEENERG